MGILEYINPQVSLPSSSSSSLFYIHATNPVSFKTIISIIFLFLYHLLWMRATISMIYSLEYITFSTIYTYNSYISLPSPSSIQVCNAIHAGGVLFTTPRPDSSNTILRRSRTKSTKITKSLQLKVTIEHRRRFRLTRDGAMLLIHGVLAAFLWNYSPVIYSLHRMTTWTTKDSRDR